MTCLYCPMGCHRDIEIKEPADYKLKGPSPEYETLGMLGTNLLIDELTAIVRVQSKQGERQALPHPVHCTTDTLLALSPHSNTF